MKLQHIIITVVLVGMVILGFTTFMADVTTNYGITVENDSEFTATYNKLDEMQDLTSGMQTTVEGSEIDSGNLIFSMSKGAWSALKMVFQSFSVFTTMITDFSDSLGLPVWFVTGIITILVATIVFLIIGAIFRFDI